MIYRYAWGPRWPDVAALTGLPVLSRKNDTCRVLARGRMNSAMVEFLSDGEVAIVSRNALRKIKPERSSLGERKYE